MLQGQHKAHVYNMKPSSWNWTVQQQLENNNRRLKLTDIDEIQTWMKGEEYLPTISDEQVVMFLHACEYDITETKETIEKCYIMRTKVKDFFSNRDLNHPYLQDAMRVAHYVPLPGFDKDGNLVILLKLNDTDASKYYYAVNMKLVYMLMDALQLEYGPVPGYVFILDGKGYTLSHMRRTSLSLAKKFINYAQEASTFYPKAIYVLNVSSILEKAVSFVKPFMKSDLFSIIQFLKPGTYDTIQKQIPLDILPEEYGGKAGPINTINSEYLKKFSAYGDWFKEEEKLRIDESKLKGGKAIKVKKTIESTTNDPEQLSLRTLAID